MRIAYRVSLHPRGVRAKEGCSTEQSTLVSAFKFHMSGSAVLVTSWSRSCPGSPEPFSLAWMFHDTWPSWLKHRSVPPVVRKVRESV